MPPKFLVPHLQSQSETQCTNLFRIRISALHPDMLRAENRSRGNGSILPLIIWQKAYPFNITGAGNLLPYVWQWNRIAHLARICVIKQRAPLENPGWRKWNFYYFYEDYFCFCEWVVYWMFRVCERVCEWARVDMTHCENVYYSQYPLKRCLVTGC